jgi:hypothetical protein
MKNLFRANIVIAVCLLATACGQALQVTSHPVSPTPTATTIPLTTTPVPSATATIESTPRPVYIPPTLIPTIDPTLAPGLLSKAFSVQTVEGVNGHKIQKITGWEYGLGGGFFRNSCIGYIWLDTNHLLLYPATGQVPMPEGWSPTKFNVVRQPVVINLENGHIWLPSVNAPASPETCATIEWSSELGVLILSEEHDGISTVSTYTYDGRNLVTYTGNLVDVSPSGTKIFLNDNTLIDLRTNKRITLDWSLKYYPEDPFSNLFWTSDETRIYGCCYFYADLTAGTSYSSTRSDFQDVNDNHQEPWGVVYRGAWIQNDTYFLPEWNWLDDGDIRHLPMLAPAKKVAIEVREKAGIPEDWSCTDIDVSPDGKYVWMTGFSDSYLVDLITFEAQYYPRKKYSGVDWSPNSKFAFLDNNDLSDETEPYSILSVIDKQLRSLPVAPLSEWIHWWHESDDILIYPSENENTLLLLDTATMSFRELPFKVEAGGYDSLIWSLNGKKIVFVAEDGSLWQADYPKFDNFEQLTPVLPNISQVNWSPDGNSISFISGSDIYIVDTVK